jgi:hypothetical protein
VSVPDFEIDASLQARRVTPLVSPDAEVTPEGVVLEREEVRSGLPEEIEPGDSYEDVAVAKRLRAETRDP